MSAIRRVGLAVFVIFIMVASVWALPRGGQGDVRGQRAKTHVKAGKRDNRLHANLRLGEKKTRKHRTLLGRSNKVGELRGKDRAAEVHGMNSESTHGKKGKKKRKAHERAKERHELKHEKTRMRHRKAHERARDRHEMRHDLARARKDKGQKAKGKMN